MPNLSQNKKVALSALAIFMVSFAFMLFFLDEKIMDENTHGANVFDSVGHDSEPKVEPKEEVEPEKTDKDWMEKIYPKIKDLENESSGRLMVDKIF